MFRENKLTIIVSSQTDWKYIKKYIFGKNCDVSREHDSSFKVWIDNEELELEALKDDYAGHISIIKNTPARQTYAKATKSSKGKIYTDLKGNRYVLGVDALGYEDVAFIPNNFFPTKEELEKQTKSKLVKFVQANKWLDKEVKTSAKKDEIIDQILNNIQ